VARFLLWRRLLLSSDWSENQGEASGWSALLLIHLWPKRRCIYLTALVAHKYRYWWYNHNCVLITSMHTWLLPSARSFVAIILATRNREILTYNIFGTILFLISLIKFSFYNLSLKSKISLLKIHSFSTQTYSCDCHFLKLDSTTKILESLFYFYSIFYSRFLFYFYSISLVALFFVHFHISMSLFM